LSTAPDTPGPGPVYIFGYGSLMWDPGFAHLERLPARAHDWHRRFTVMSTTSWGSADRPGVCAALHPGGTVWGRAFAVDPAELAGVLAYLDERERAYLRRRIRVTMRRGDGLIAGQALTYVANPAHPRLAADMPVPERLARIRHGIGDRGSSLDYLRNTVAALRDDGHIRSDAHRILAMVEA